MRIRVGPETDFAGAIYGQVLGGGAVVALSRHDETPIQIATAVSRALPTPRAAGHRRVATWKLVGVDTEQVASGTAAVFRRLSGPADRRDFVVTSPPDADTG